MLSNSHIQGSKNTIDNVFTNISVVEKEPVYFRQFLDSQDFSIHTVKAMVFDMRKFARYFTLVNNEPFDTTRVTTMDLTAFKRYLRAERQQAVATINRALVSVRRYLDWLVAKEYLNVNPGKGVKELRRQPLVPRGLERSQVRKLLREIDLRKDIRSKAIFTLFLHTGCRVSDLVQIELQDLIISERSGSVVFRNGKGSKQRQVPLPLPARRALQDYLQIRPSVPSSSLFIGERGALTDIGIRNLCDKFSCICGCKIYPHLLRHTMAHQFLQDTNNDIVALAQILGHENLNTTKLYIQRTEADLSAMAEKLSY
jgi:integrase/recombinase XerC